MTIFPSVLDGLLALILLAIAGWLVYAVIKPGPALATLAAAGPAKQRWLFLMLTITCLIAVMNLALGSMAGLSATYIRYLLQSHR